MSDNSEQSLKKLTMTDEVEQIEQGPLKSNRVEHVQKKPNKDKSEHPSTQKVKNGHRLTQKVQNKHPAMNTYILAYNIHT